MPDKKLLAAAKKAFNVKANDSWSIVVPNQLSHVARFFNCDTSAYDDVVDSRSRYHPVILLDDIYFSVIGHVDTGGTRMVQLNLYRAPELGSTGTAPLPIPLVELSQLEASLQDVYQSNIEVDRDRGFIDTGFNQLAAAYESLHRN